MTDDIRQRVEGCFALVFPELNPEEIVQASTASVAKWDSVATLNLIALIEEECQIELQPEQLLLDDPDGPLSFELILNYAKSLRDSKLKRD